MIQLRNTKSGRRARAAACTVATLLLGWQAGASAATESVLRINVGGDNYTDSAGRLWSADRGYNTGNVARSANSIANTVDDAIYNSQRWDAGGSPELGYSLPLPNGDYQVELHVAETWSRAFTPGVRVFDVLAEGRVAVDNLDIAAAAGGGNRAHVVRIPVTVADGRLDLEFMHQVQNPTVAGIEVLRVVPDPVTEPAPQPDTSGSGTLLREYWSNVSGSTIASLTGNSRYPASPTGSSQLQRFELPSNIGDNYGTRVRGYVHPPTSGYYTFWLSGDDDSQLLLSGDETPANARRIASVTGWTRPQEWDKYSSQRSAPVYLVAGRRYYVEALHKEASGGDNLAVAWQLGSGSRDVIPGSALSPWLGATAPAPAPEPEPEPTPAPAPTTGTGTGLTGQYFDNMDFTRPLLSRLDPQVGFNWRSGAPAGGMGADTFSVRWTGQVEPVHASGSRTYTFITRSDDGVRLWVNNQLIIDRWQNQSVTEQRATISLDAGRRYDIRLEYFENGGAAEVELLWLADGLARQRIPASRLYPGATAPQPTVTDTDGDGLPDTWEQQYGLDPSNPNDASADPDSDGYSSLVEFQEGTSPTSASSRPAPATNGTASLSWNAPVTRTDGTPIAMSELSGYRLRYGTIHGEYSQVVTISGAYTTTRSISGLDPRRSYYFVVTAVDVGGLEGPASNEVSVVPQP